MTDHPPASGRLSPHAIQFAREISTKGVLFGLPCYGGLHPATAQGLLDTQRVFAEHGLTFNYMFLSNESLIPRGRNGIANFFLQQSGCDRLFFIDADIGFDGQQVLRLLAHDHDVVAGAYRKKRLNEVAFAVNWLPDANGQVQADQVTGAIEARHLATGFMCIKRRCLETMAAAFPHLIYRDLQGKAGDPPRFGHGFFDLYTDPVTLEPLSEDYAFCNRWRALGGSVWCDPGLILEHYGTVPLVADPIEHLGGGAAVQEFAALRARVKAASAEAAG